DVHGDARRVAELHVLVVAAHGSPYLESGNHHAARRRDGVRRNQKGSEKTRLRERLREHGRVLQQDRSAQPTKTLLPPSDRRDEPQKNNAGSAAASRSVSASTHPASATIRPIDQYAAMLPIA